jgi:hypothetical protein
MRTNSGSGRPAARNAKRSLKAFTVSGSQGLFTAAAASVASIKPANQTVLRSALGKGAAVHQRIL